MADVSTPKQRCARTSIFGICVLALFTAAIAFSLRTAASGAIKAAIFDPIDPARSGQLTGAALGSAFAGFALSLLAVSPILDLVGAKRVLLTAAVCYVAGTALVVLAPVLGGSSNAGDFVYWGFGVTGIGWGCTEGSINPVIAALYADEKTKRLNMLHAWWPAGIVIGGLGSVVLFQVWHVDWRVAIALIAVPAVVLGAWILPQSFPKTESASLGISFKEMIKEPFIHPTFWIFFVIMFLTSATELAPGSWVDIALSQTVHMPGILVLVYVAAIMFVMRHFAGPLARYFTDIGLLWFAAIPAGLGLLLLSVANSQLTALVAATVWAFGVCFMWPTMLAATAYRYPRGGSWTIGLVGFAGAMSMRFVLPELGAIYDKAKIARAGGEAAFLALRPGQHLSEVLAYAAAQSFQAVAVIPVVLLLAFGVLYLFERKRRLGGPNVPTAKS